MDAVGHFLARSGQVAISSLWDRIDFAILEALQNNARLSNKELAAGVGLAPSSCLQRVRSLDKRGILRGYHARIDEAAFGIGLRAFVAIRLVRSSRAAFQHLWEHLLVLPEVVCVSNVSGEFDLQVEVVLKDVSHLRDLVVDSIAVCEEVERVVTSVVFSSERKPGLSALMVK